MNDKNSNGYSLALKGGNPPTGSSYWVAEGHLLAGAYPGDPDPKKHPETIKALLDAGIRAFVNLMEESETNRSGKAFNPYDVLVGQFAPDAMCRRHPIRTSTSRPSRR